MIKYYFVVDIGTGSTRVALTGSDNKIISCISFDNQYYADELYEDAQYFLPEELFNSIAEALVKIASQYPEIKVSAITSSGARESIVLLDKDCNAFYGLPNIDNRGRNWESYVHGKEEIYRLTGRPVSTDFPALKLRGLKEKRPEIYDKIDKITSLSEFLGVVLCNRCTIEYSQACETQLFNIFENDWDAMLSKAFEIDHHFLPEILPTGTSLGRIKKHMADKLNISSDCEFIIGGADTQMAVKFMHITPGEIAIVSGTTSPVVSLLSHPIHDEREGCWVDCYLGGETYQIETNPGVTGLNYQRVKELFFPGKSYEELDAVLREKTGYKMIATLTTQCFIKDFSIRTGGFIMSNPFKNEIDGYDFLWSVGADIACSIAVQVENILRLVLNEHDYFIGCGGGFQSGFIAQLIADITQKNIILKEGYAQASLCGGIVVCNTYFNIVTKRDEDPQKIICITPQKNKLLLDYFEAWNKMRMKING